MKQIIKRRYAVNSNLNKDNSQKIYMELEKKYGLEF